MQPQKRSITIVGIGTLGSRIALLLSPHFPLTLVDFDDVEEKNLGIQKLYSQYDIGKPKVEAAQQALLRQHPAASIQAINQKLTSSNLHLLSGLVIDCTDNMTARLLLNDALYQKTPWLHTAASQDKGVVAAIIPGQYCFQCIYPNNQDAEDCIQQGISESTASKVALIASQQAITILNNQQPEQALIRLRNHQQEKIIISRRCQRCQQFL